MPTATLDTNLLQEFWRNRDRVDVVQDLLDLAQNGRLDLAVTTRIHADVPRRPLSDRISKLPMLGVRQVGSVFRLDVSRLDCGDVLGGDRQLAEMESIKRDLQLQGRKIPEWADWDHIYGHYSSGRDVFLTWDRGILNIAAQLKTKLGVIVMKPEDYLSSLARQR